MPDADQVCTKLAITQLRLADYQYYHPASSTAAPSSRIRREADTKTQARHCAAPTTAKDPAEVHEDDSDDECREGDRVRDGRGERGGGVVDAAVACCGPGAAAE